MYSLFLLQNWCQKWSQRLVKGAWCPTAWWWSRWWSERSDWWWVWWWELRNPTLNRSVWLCKSEISHLIKKMCQDFQYGEISHQDNVSRISPQQAGYSAGWASGHLLHIRNIDGSSSEFNVTLKWQNIRSFYRYFVISSKHAGKSFCFHPSLSDEWRIRIVKTDYLS